MPRFIASVLPCLLRRIKLCVNLLPSLSPTESFFIYLSISSMILAIGMNLSNTAHKQTPINVESAGVIRMTILVRSYFLSDKSRVTSFLQITSGIHVIQDMTSCSLANACCTMLLEFRSIKCRCCFRT